MHKTMNAIFVDTVAQIQTVQHSALETFQMWKFLALSTLWKFHKLPAIQILQENKFW